ncbi:hypothetical protein BpHYR1_052604 [Brachionus plicatilis]|uniref:Uncharacterized protein n=1 Tax=Brachionus plicatilis TaxID=10195 RepID=A0A3M7PTE2_BRAPC|nr:hypothetical protein BpHYR1_052604 [Brachionus plicatilis]
MSKLSSTNYTFLVLCYLYQLVPSDVSNISMSQLPNELLNMLSKGVFSDIASSLLKGHLLIIVLFQINIEFSVLHSKSSIPQFRILLVKEK